MGLAERFSDVIPHNVNQKCSIKLKNGMKYLKRLKPRIKLIQENLLT